MLNTLVVSVLTKFITGGVELERMRPGCSEALCCLRWCFGVFSTFKDFCVISF